MMTESGREPAREISLTVNGSRRTCVVPERRNLADCLRHDLGLTGTHVGCEHGVCGACTVLVDGTSARSCLMLAVQAEGCEVHTVESLAEPGGEPAVEPGGEPVGEPVGEAGGAGRSGRRLNRLQQAFQDHHGLQCGFCTPGILMSLTELLRDDPDPDEEAVRLTLSGHLCRCTGYQNIVAAALAAAARLREDA